MSNLPKTINITTQLKQYHHQISAIMDRVEKAKKEQEKGA